MKMSKFFFAVKPGPISGPLKTSDLTPDSVSLSWKQPLDDGGSPITNYILEARDSKSYDWKQVAKLPSSTTRYTVNDLEEGETYDFRVSAVNKVGQGKPVQTEASVRPQREPGNYI